MAERVPARIAGALWLLSIAAGIYAEVVVRGGLIVHGDAAATAANILSHAAAYRLGFTADAIGDMAYLGATAIVYVLLRGVDRYWSAAMLAFGIAGCALMAANLLNLYAPLVLLPVGAAPLAMAALRLHGAGYSLAIAVFSVQVAALGVLIRRSRFVPPILGALFLIEAACNTIGSFGTFLDLAWVARAGNWLLLPGLPAEAGMALWLLLGRMDVPHPAR